VSFHGSSGSGLALLLRVLELPLLLELLLELLLLELLLLLPLSLPLKSLAFLRL
jgi:hypothetical protein